MIRIYGTRRRDEALKAVAHQLGLTFEGNDWRSSSRTPQLECPLFGRGDSAKEFQNIISGIHEGMTINFFDYTFRNGRSKTSQTVAAFTGDVWLPTFEVAPLDLVRKVSGATSGKGIQLEAGSDFSKRFRLLGSDEKKVRMLFSRELRYFFEQLGTVSKWHLEGSEFTLIVYREGEIVKPRDYSEFIKRTTDMAQKFINLSR